MKKLKTSFFVLLAVVCTPVLNQAEEQDIAIPVKTLLEPQIAAGIVFTPDGVEQVMDTTVTRADNGTVLVRFPYDDGAISPSTMASALVLTESGDFAMGAVKPLALLAGDGGSVYDLPICADQKGNFSLHSQMSALDNLVKVRMGLRSNRVKTLKKTLTQDTLDKLVKLEAGFGLLNEQPLSADLNPTDLVDRFARLKDVLVNYRQHKEKRLADSREQ